MPVAIKKRKVSATIAKSTSSVNANAQTLNSFTLVTKAKSSLAETSTKTLSFNISTSRSGTLSPKCRKRKSEDDEEGAADHAAVILEAAQDGNTRSVLHNGAESYGSISRTPRKIHCLESLDTPTKGARGLLDRLFLTSNTPTKTPISSKAGSSPTLSVKGNQTIVLPDELLDLINLHAAFLTTLSLHYAHNGIAAPADLRLLCPGVSRAWGKRAVTAGDIRRTLGVLNASFLRRSKKSEMSMLSLSDYGHQKICVEIETVGIKGRLGAPFDEELLNETFVTSLKKAWEGRPANANWNGFLDSLPQEPITLCPSIVKMSSMSKGQQRLKDLKVGITVKNDPREIPVDAFRPKAPLLERLRAKQILNSALPPPPSAEELSRRNALQKMDEVAAVLSILSTSSSIGQQRISFTLPTVFGKLRDSLKTPMSKKESDVCVRLLAAEIAPEWVRLAKMGKVEALVFDRDGKPTAAEMMGRLLRAGSKS